MSYGLLRRKDLLAILEASERLQGCDTEEQMVEESLAVLRTMIPSDSSSWLEITVPSGRVVGAFGDGAMNREFAAGYAEAHRAMVWQHPALSITEDDRSSACRISDLVTTQGYRQLGLFNEVLRYFGVHYQGTLSAGYTADGRILGYGVERRRRDFTNREMQLLSAFAPYLHRTHRDLELRRLLFTCLFGDVPSAPTEALLPCGGVLLDSRGSVLRIDPEAQRMLNCVFARDAPTSIDLPSTVQRWFEVQVQAAHSNVLVRDRAFVVENAPESFIIMTAVKAPGRDLWLLAINEQHTGIRARPKARLSTREREVMELVASGKMTKQIASRLQISQATAKAHIAHAMEKLGAKTRASAVKAAIAQGELHVSAKNPGE